MNHGREEAPQMTTADLLDLFARKATKPLPESNQLLVRHLQCKESLKAAHCLVEAINRFAGRDDHPLPTPAAVLAPPA
jgi:hypothetical protein